MARSANFDDIPKVARMMLAAFGDEFRKERSMINNAAKKTLNGLPRAYASQLMRARMRSNPDKRLGFSKLLFLSKVIDSYPKKRNPDKTKDAFGARMRMRKGVAIPIGFSKNTVVRWNAQGYAALLAKGSYKTGVRHHKSGKSTGIMRPMGNWMELAEVKLETQIQREWAKYVKEAAIKAGNRARDRKLKQIK